MCDRVWKDCLRYILLVDFFAESERERELITLEIASQFRHANAGRPTEEERLTYSSSFPVLLVMRGSACRCCPVVDLGVRAICDMVEH